MSRIHALYAIEAVLCGGPVTVAAIYGLPWLVLGPLLMWPQSPIAAVAALLWVAGCVVALVAFWHLAISTIRRQSYRFSILFWLGTIGALFALADVSRWSEGFVALAMFIAPVLCAGHFSALHRLKVSQ